MPTTQREGGSLRPSDPPALRRLIELDLTPTSMRRSEQVEEHARRTLAAAPVRRRGAPRPFGHQAGLDGLRALAVIVVILYHGGFSWIHGGWIGVEVFFVVSGFLITTLLLEERERSGRVALGPFWVRRARRLLPALGVMLVVVAAVTLAVGTAAQRGELRRDLPWSILYLGNWGQIVGGIPYYAADPPLLRHLWSLAIEEQFYLVWPLVFVGLTRTRLSNPTIAKLLGGTSVVVMVWVFWLHAGGPGPVAVFGGVDRVNFMYLSTFTRAGGLLLGCAAAFVWRPWRMPVPTQGAARPGRVLDVVGGVTLGALGCIASVAVLTDGYVYQWLLPLVSVLSLVAVLVAVHPAAAGMRRALGCAPLVAVGVRSYGLYLWHWPIFVLVGATTASAGRFVIAVALTIVAAELSYRFVEVPVRKGALGEWWRTAGDARARPVLAAGCAVALLGACYVAVDPFDRAAGGADATFAVPTTSAVPAPAPAAPGVVAPVAPAPAVPAAPRRVTIVGDSQAHALAVNLPDGIDPTFTVTDGGLDGCSVYDTGRVRSSRASFDNSFSSCAGWAAEWAAAATDADAEIVLVVLGAWDVFDLEQGDGTRLTFGTPAWDDYVRTNLQSGLDAVAATGAHVALLEVPCMRPVKAEGAGVPPLPERGDDAHVAHVNELFRGVAAANPSTVTFVDGPDAWCADESVAGDIGMRWDGVHVYKPGAKLIYDTIAPALLALPLPGR